MSYLINNIGREYSSGLIMKSHSLLIVALLIGCLIVSAYGLQTMSKNITSSGRVGYGTNLLKLHIDGTFIKDEDGRQVKLVGFNGHLYHGEYWAYQLYEEDVQWIAERGFNVIRVVTDWNVMEPQDDVYDMTYVELLDDLVMWAETHGVYLIIDNHNWNWAEEFGGGGLPTWVTQEGSYADKIQCAKDFWSGNGHGAYMQQKYIEHWQWIASRYTGKDVVFAYDLMNEPNNPLMSDYSFLTLVPQYSIDLFKQVILAIRNVDADTIVMCDVITTYDDDGGASYYTNQIDLPNVMWGRSFYDMSSRNNYAKYPDGNVPQELRDILKGIVIGLYNKFVRDFSRPFFLLEISTDDFRWNLGSQLWFNDTMQFFSEVWQSPYELSFTWWRYSKDSSGWSPREWNPPTNEDTMIVPLLQNHTVP